MRRKIPWAVMSGLMALSLVMAACAPAAPTPTPTTPVTPATPTTPTTPTAPVQETPQKETVKPVAEAPKYGGALTRTVGTDPTNWGPLGSIAATTPAMVDLWAGDWAKGPAGGYGTSETDWAHSYDRWDLNKGVIIESVKWSADAAKNEGTIVYQIRQGIRYGLNPASEASRLVGGRVLTADDVVFSLKTRVTDPDSYIYAANIELRTANITKTGPWEVTIKLPLAALVTGILRFTDATLIYPPEVFQRYNKMLDWKTIVGTGPFMLTEYIPGSQIVYVRNPNYFEKDPVGPGKDNQLPYLDALRTLIIPDASTRLAALRTGKVDHQTDLSYLDTAQMMKQVPALKKIERVGSDGRGTPAMMRTDKAPFNDVRVRRAMVMAVDIKGIRDSLFGGLGSINTYPYDDSKGYHDIYLGVDDPDLPASTRELFSYNPDKAKQLLKDAGYPNGFKTSILVNSTGIGYGGVSDVDYYSVVKDMLAKVGVDLTLDLKTNAVVNTTRIARTHEAIATTTTAPVATFYLGIAFQGTSQYNLSMLNDPVINAALDEVRLAAITDMSQARKIFREKISKYVLDQAFGIPNIQGVAYTLWWPWLKGYSGERTIGYDNSTWPQYIWYDQALKKSMGY